MIVVIRNVILISGEMLRSVTRASHALGVFEGLLAQFLALIFAGLGRSELLAQFLSFIF